MKIHLEVLADAAVSACRWCSRHRSVDVFRVGGSIDLEAVIASGTGALQRLLARAGRGRGSSTGRIALWGLFKPPAPPSLHPARWSYPTMVAVLATSMVSVSAPTSSEMSRLGSGNRQVYSALLESAESGRSHSQGCTAPGEGHRNGSCPTSVCAFLVPISPDRQSQPPRSPSHCRKDLDSPLDSRRRFLFHGTRRGSRARSARLTTVATFLCKNESLRLLSLRGKGKHNLVVCIQSPNPDHYARFCSSRQASWNFRTECRFAPPTRAQP